MTHNSHDDVPLDLRAIDPDSGSEAAAFTRAVMSRVRAMPPPAEGDVGVLWGIWSLSLRLAAAGAAIATLLLIVRVWDAAHGQRAPATVIEALGVPPGFVLPRDGNGELR